MSRPANAAAPAPSAATSSRRAGVVAAVSLVLATAFWAGNYVVGAVAVDELDPIGLVLLRWGLAVLPLVVIAQLVERPDWRALLRLWPWLLAQTVTGLLGYTLLLYSALQFTDALSASLINAFNPALISIAAVIFLRERLSRTAIVGIVVALVGVLIVLSRGSVETLVSGGFGLGDLLMVAAIVAWTAYTVLGRRAPRIPAISSTAVQAVLAVVILLPVSLVAGGPTLPTSARRGGRWRSSSSSRRCCRTCCGTGRSRSSRPPARVSSST